MQTAYFLIKKEDKNLDLKKRGRGRPLGAKKKQEILPVKFGIKSNIKQ